MVAAVAYRAAAKIEEISTGIVHDYSRKSGVDYSIILSPILATGANKWLADRAELWNKVEEGEKRKDARLARDVTIALPKELSTKAKISLITEYVKEVYVAKGMVADVNLHHLDSDNPHAHVTLTMRDLVQSPDGSVAFGNKNRDWDDRDLLMAQRKQWETTANAVLERHGIKSQIDCRTLAAQGIERIPQIHLGVDVNAMQRKGIETDRGNRWRDIQRWNEAKQPKLADIKSQLEDIYKAENKEEQQRRKAAEDAEKKREALRQKEIDKQQTKEQNRVNEQQTKEQNRVNKLAATVYDITPLEQGKCKLLAGYLFSQQPHDESLTAKLEVCYGTTKILELDRGLDGNWCEKVFLPKQNRKGGISIDDTQELIADLEPSIVNELAKIAQQNQAIEAAKAAELAAAVQREIDRQRRETEKQEREAAKAEAAEKLRLEREARAAKLAAGQPGRDAANALKESEKAARQVERAARQAEKDAEKRQREIDRAAALTQRRIDRQQQEIEKDNAKLAAAAAKIEAAEQRDRELWARCEAEVEAEFEARARAEIEVEITPEIKTETEIDVDSEPEIQPEWIANPQPQHINQSNWIDDLKLELGAKQQSAHEVQPVQNLEQESELELEVDPHQDLDRLLGNNIMWYLQHYKQNSIATKYHVYTWQPDSQSIEVKRITETLNPPLITLQYRNDTWVTQNKDVELKKEILKQAKEVNQTLKEFKEQNISQTPSQSRGRKL